MTLAEQPQQNTYSHPAAAFRQAAHGHNDWYIHCCIVDAGQAAAAEVVEEVIAEHPPPPSATFQAGSKLAGRAPVHLAMTAATLSHFPSLHPSQTQALAGGCDTDSLPHAQVSHTFFVDLLAAQVLHLAVTAAALSHPACLYPPQAQPLSGQGNIYGGSARNMKVFFICLGGTFQADILAAILGVKYGRVQAP